MPNIKSAKKRVKVIETKTLRNKMLKSNLKTIIKKFEVAVNGDDKAKATEALCVAVKRIDQAVAKGILKKNTASRKKSQLALKLNKMSV